jgi:hypothetical protein
MLFSMIQTDGKENFITKDINKKDFQDKVNRLFEKLQENKELALNKNQGKKDQRGQKAP